jgi:ABC-type lipoprotein release transport system permease subunit
VKSFFLIALRNILKNRSRSGILAGSITAVTLLLVMLNGFTAGIEETILQNGTALLSGHVNIAGFFKISQNSAAPMVVKKEALWAIARKTVPSDALIIERIKAWGRIVSDTNSIQLPIWGVDMKSEKRILGKLLLSPQKEYLEKLREGEKGDESEGDLSLLEKKGYLVLFASHAKKLKVRFGDQITISMPTYRNVNNTLDVRVAAVLQDLGMMSNYTIFMNDQDAREIYQMTDDATGQLMIFLSAKDDTQRVENLLRKAMADEGIPLMEKESAPFWMKFDRVAGESWTGQKIDITTWEDETAFIKWIVDIFNALTFALVTILMVIIVFGLVNTLFISIRERTSEIGTLRAIGMQKRSVVFMIFLESLILAIAGALGGIILGILFATILNLIGINVESESLQMFLMARKLIVVLRAPSLLGTFLFINIFLALGALYPAYRAGKMKPITAINTVN